MAAGKGQVEILELIFERKETNENFSAILDREIMKKDLSPILPACKGGYLNILQKFLEYYPTAYNHPTVLDTCLVLASEANKPDMTRFLAFKFFN